MTFDWMNALKVTMCLMLPCGIMGAILSFFEEHFAACAIFALMAFVAVFALAGMPEEVLEL